jgi:hypothetical protein
MVYQMTKKDFHLPPSVQRNLAFFVLIGMLGILGLSTTARATSIGPICTTCNGGIYTLSSDGKDIGGSDVTDTYQVTLTVNTAGIPAYLSSVDGHGGAYYIDSVAVKISNSAIEALLLSAPDGTSNWEIVSGGINANGCDGSGSGFECADWVFSSLGTPVDTVTDSLSWVFKFEINKGTFFGLEGTPGASLASIKMTFVENYKNIGPPAGRGATDPATPNRVGSILSENIGIQETGKVPPTGDPLPIPGTLLLIGAGLIGFSRKLKHLI